MKYLPALALAFTFAACQQPSKKEEKPVVAYVTPSHHSESITKVFEAHGGYEQWASMKQLAYERGDEKTITNLNSRKIRIESASQTIGYDGTDVWVTPDTVDASRARFYHNLYFYFYAMPFVVGDPGVFYKDLEPREIKGETYGGVQVSYGDGVGDSPKDYYIIWYDQETYQMKWLMYTVTYRSQEASENFSLIGYDAWSEFEGVVLPTAFKWYQYEDGVVGDVRGEGSFTNIMLSTEAPDESLFTKPEGAQVSPPPGS